MLEVASAVPGSLLLAGLTTKPASGIGILPVFPNLLAGRMSQEWMDNPGHGFCFFFGAVRGRLVWQDGAVW